MWRQFVPARLAQLEQGFATVEPRMRALGLARAGLRVQALGFEPLAEEPGLLLGVLVTPWCLNLVLLPLQHCDRPGPTLACPRHFGDWALEFQPATLAEPGAYASCGLFSDMARFADQAAAQATGEASLQALRDAAAGVAPAAPSPSRRGFLFGRQPEARA